MSDLLKEMWSKYPFVPHTDEGRISILRSDGAKMLYEINRLKGEVAELKGLNLEADANLTIGSARMFIKDNARFRDEVTKLTAERDELHRVMLDNEKILGEFAAPFIDSPFRSHVVDAMIIVDNKRKEAESRLSAMTAERDSFKGDVESVLKEAKLYLVELARVKSRLSAMEGAVREYLMQTDDIQILIDALTKLEGKE